jgi:hypothetical protein
MLAGLAPTQVISIGTTGGCSRAPDGGADRGSARRAMLNGGMGLCDEGTAPLPLLSVCRGWLLPLMSLPRLSPLRVSLLLPDEPSGRLPSLPVTAVLPAAPCKPGCACCPEYAPPAGCSETWVPLVSESCSATAFPLLVGGSAPAGPAARGWKSPPLRGAEGPAASRRPSGLSCDALPYAAGSAMSRAARCLTPCCRHSRAPCLGFRRLCRPPLCGSRCLSTTSSSWCTYWECPWLR